MADSDDLLTIDGVCQVWQVGKTKCYELIKAAGIQPVRLHGLMDNRYRRSDVIAAVLLPGEGSIFHNPHEPYGHGVSKPRHPDRLRMIEAEETRIYGVPIRELPAEHPLFADKG